MPLVPQCNIDPLASAALESTRASSVLSQASRRPTARRVARIQITAATQIPEARSTCACRGIGLCEPGQLEEPSSIVTGSERPAYNRLQHTHSSSANTPAQAKASARGCYNTCIQMCAGSHRDRRFDSHKPASQRERPAQMSTTVVYGHGVLEADVQRGKLHADSQHGHDPSSLPACIHYLLLSGMKPSSKA